MCRNSLELTILMPCLNEAETLEKCISKAKTFLEKNKVNGEVLIADNGSTDGSQEIALKNGARIINVPIKGYGAALIEGTKAALGKYIIMGDADDSYNFLNLMPFAQKLREGYDLVMGNRFAGGITKNAMPKLHRYLGNPVLSFIGRLFFNSKIKDFHCGLRGYNREKVLSLNLQTNGMEYASEMIVKATLNKFNITEVPTTLDKDGRSRPPHLRSFRDGWRHLKFLLMYAPNWLFVLPATLLMFVGIISTCLISAGSVKIGHITLDIHTLLYAGVSIILGFSLFLFNVFSKIFAFERGYLPKYNTSSFYKNLSSEKIMLFGLILFLLGILASIAAVILWQTVNFGELDPSRVMRLTIPATVSMVVGIESIFAGFFIGILRIK
jgi:glycosyltransferase involved in cell wall biosynthesis